MQQNYIKELCKLKKVRQTELAMLLGMREDSFSIALKRNTLSIAKLEKIAAALNVPMWQLFASPEDIAGSGDFVAFVKDGKNIYHADSWHELEKIVNEIKGEESEWKPIEHKNIRGKEYFK